MTLDGFTGAQLQAISTDACSRAVRLFDRSVAISLHLSHNALTPAERAAGELDCDITLAAANEAWGLHSAAIAELQRQAAQEAGQS